ncbi:MAG: TRAP transporter substrate-binding protein [Thermodesulfobacteriota bacterium]|jgi:tripartite ATP-independent transporter DctP family solute receptor
MKRITRMGILFILSFILVFSVQVVQAAPIVLRLGNIEAITNPASLACERMAKMVEEKSGGRLKIEFFPASQLGNAITQIEGVMMGTQDMFQGAAEWMGQFEKDYNILALAFGFRDQKHLQAFFRSPINSQIKERLRKDRGIRIISENWDRSPRVLLSKKPVYSPKDLQGIKMRVPEIEMYLRVWKAMGTQPTQVAWGETYLALMQGVVDAMEGPFDTLLGMKFYEAAPNVSLTNHLLTASSVSINDQKFQSLPKDLQDILAVAANESGDYFTKLGIESYDRDKKEMESKGAKFIVVDRKPFQEKMRSLIAEMEGQERWSKGLYQKIQEVK